MATRSNVDRLKSLIPVSENSTATPKNNSGGLFRLQAVLNNRVYEQRNNNPPQFQESTTQVSQDSSNPQNNYVSNSYSDNNATQQNSFTSENNSEDTSYQGLSEYQSNPNGSNIRLAQNELGYTTPMSAEDQIKLAAKYSDKNMERDAAMAGVASLQNAFGKTGGFSTVFGSYTPR